MPSANVLEPAAPSRPVCADAWKAEIRDWFLSLTSEQLDAFRSLYINNKEHNPVERRGRATKIARRSKYDSVFTFVPDYLVYRDGHPGSGFLPHGHFKLCVHCWYKGCREPRHIFCSVLDGHTNDMIEHLKRMHCDDPLVLSAFPQLFHPFPAQRDRAANDNNDSMPCATLFDPAELHRRAVDVEIARCLGLSFFDDAEIRGFMKFVNPLAAMHLPHRTLARKILDELYLSYKAKLIKLLKSRVGAVALSVDGWTSRAVYGFVAVIITFASRRPATSLITRKSVLLDMVPCTSKTGLALADVIKSTLRSSSLLLSDLLATIQDNASTSGTMERALNTDANHPIALVFCAQHSLQRAVIAMIGPIQIILAKVRSFVRLISSSTNLRDLFRRVVGNRNRTVPLDCEAKWGTTHRMLKGLLELREQVEQVVCFAIANKSHQSREHGKLKELSEFTQVDWDIIAKLERLLHSFSVAMDLLGQDGRSTLSSVLPIYFLVVEKTLDFAGDTDAEFSERLETKT
ncbi:hypothetical protein GGF32_007868, partial [Allomyces javanicus]